MSANIFRQTSVYWWAAVLWTIGIVIGCSLPPSTLSSVDPVLSFDKLIHFGLFAGFSVLWMRALRPRRGTKGLRLWRQGGRLTLIGVLFAGATELYQHLLPMERTVDPYDALADSTGVVVGVATYVTYRYYTDSKVQSSEPS